MVYNHVKQPNVDIQNAYSYLLSKRLATVEMQRNAATFESNEFTKSPEFKALQSNMGEKSLYELENDMVNRIMHGKF